MRRTAACLCKMGYWLITESLAEKRQITASIAFFLRAPGDRIRSVPRRGLGQGQMKTIDRFRPAGRWSSFKAGRLAAEAVALALAVMLPSTKSGGNPAGTSLALAAP